MSTKPPLFNSKLMKIYLEYIAETYPDIDVSPVFEYSGISPFEINESGHWFDEDQVDRFYTYLVDKTGNRNLARDVGRYVVSARAMGVIKKFVAGLMDTSSIYMQIEKSYKVLSRAAEVSTRKLGPNKVEITTSPIPGLVEKPYMCENRTGILEALSIIFTGKFATVQEHSCVNSGNACCRYVVSWEEADFWLWKKIAAYSLCFSVFISVLMFFSLSTHLWASVSGVLLAATSFLFMRAAFLEKEELLRAMETEGDTAKELLDEMEIRYRNAMMVQEIGQTISGILDPDQLLATVMNTMQKHLDYECGAVYIVDEKNKQLQYARSYGCDDSIRELIQKITFRFEDSENKWPFINAFLEKKPLLVNNVEDWQQVTLRFRERLAGYFRIRSFICIPIVYEKASMGLLFAANPVKSRLLTQSDLSLLSAVASEIAVSMANGISFHKLKESQARYKLLAENINDVIWKMDLKMNIQYVSPSYEKLTGYSLEEAKKLSLDDLLPASSLRKMQSLLRENLDAIQNSESANVSVTAEIECFHKNGGTVWTEVAATFELNDDGQPKAILGVSRDIMERKRAEKEKRLLEERLRQKHKMEAIGTMAGGIAHDFNNILGIILGNAELAIYDLDLSDSLHPHMFEIKKASLRGKEVVMQLLNFTRQTPQKKQTIEAREIIQESLDLLSITLPSSIRLDTDLSGSRACILADPVQIQQVVINLGTNAAQAMTEQGGALSVFLEERIVNGSRPDAKQQMPDGNYVVLTMADTGCGIPPEIIERIFDPYFTTKAVGKGTGMGLSVVHGIIQNIDGRIDVESEVGQGTTFTVYLPVTSTVAIPVPTICSVESFYGNERILLVDDEEKIASLGKRLLTNMGYRVTTMTSPLDVVAEFQANPGKYQLVITDMTMPGLTGDRLAAKLMEIQKNIPIILCTGFNDRIDQEKAEAMGIRAFMMKPIEKKDLARTVRSILDEA